jgi:hypothetical protein
VKVGDEVFFKNGESAGVWIITKIDKGYVEVKQDFCTSGGWTLSHFEKVSKGLVGSISRYFR